MRLLLVDDDSSILQMLETIVQALEPGWQTQRADSGPRALKIMENESFDLIISDMGMPVMTGAQLLNEVMRRYPETSRIILSGYSEHDHILQTVGATHQFLAKPFTIPAFQTALRRICAVRELARNDRVQKLLPPQASLPNVPAVYFNIVDLLHKSPSDPASVVATVSSDPEITNEIIRLVNLQVSAPGQPVASLNDAFTLLGIGAAPSLALCAHLLSTFESPDQVAWPTEPVWHHCFRVAQNARKIALIETGNETFAEQVFTAGLLHEVGRLLLAQNHSALFLPLPARAAVQTKPLHELERETFAATHAEIGACLLHRWGLPTPIIEAVAFHCEPARVADPSLAPLTFLHVANALDEAKQSQQAAPLLLDSAYLDQLGLSDRLSNWQQALL
jgi:HD-like signal output (HDOD) protein